jgi:regulator of nucleoside diphosphate kinase
MIGTSVLSRTNVVITEVDFDRLNELARSPRYRGANSVMLAGLRDELAHGMVVAPPNVPKSVVTMRSRVRVRDLETDESQTYTLVYPEEADIDEGKLSILAPLATALLGKRTGHVVEFDAPAGLRRLKVEKILYQPEAAGDFHL